jgi:hypothetical protein
MTTTVEPPPASGLEKEAESTLGQEPERSQSWNSPSGLWLRKTTVIAALSIAAILLHLVLRFAFRATAALTTFLCWSPSRSAACLFSMTSFESSYSHSHDQRAADSRYAKIMNVMRECEATRPQLRRLGDQLGAIYTPVALTVALLAWAITGESIRFLAVLVIGTP